MSLQAVVDTIDAVPEPARALYAEKDGKFHLQFEGMAPVAKVKEFRDNNIALKKQLDDLAKKFDGIDPAKVRDLQEQARKVQEGELIAAGKIDDLLQQRIAPMQAEHAKALKAAQEKAGALEQHLNALLIDGAIRDAAGQAGVRATAIDDVLLRGRATFKIVDGKAVPMDGDKVIFSGKTGEPMPVGEWIAGLTERAPHLFEPSQGGGSKEARSNTGAGGATVRRDDKAAFLANMGKIAKGEVKVV
jgi:hypothetical protein